MFGEKKKLTNIVLPVGRKRFAKPTDIWVVERLQNANLPPERPELSIVIVAADIITIAVLGRGGVREVLVPVDDLDGDPFARLARHGFHHGGKSAAAKLIRHVVGHMDAALLERY